MGGVALVTPEEPPEDVRSFLRGHIPSVGHMEALVLTVEDPRAAWTVESLARRLFVPDARARTLLRDLAADGLVEETAESETWRFSRESTPLTDVARRAVRLYREQLVLMTGLIRSNAAPGSQLADAFRFRKE